MSKYGRPKIAVENVRKHRIGVRVSPVEFAELKAKAKTLAVKPAAYLRMAALDRRLPATPAPAVNVAQYGALARLSGNLNQIAHGMNINFKPENAELVSLLTKTLNEVQKLRASLLGLDDDS